MLVVSYQVHVQIFFIFDAEVFDFRVNFLVLNIGEKAMLDGFLAHGEGKTLEFKENANSIKAMLMISQKK